MVDVWANSLACYPRTTCHNSGCLRTYLLTYLRLTLLAATWRIRCHDSRATSHIAGCCHLVNSLSRFQSHWRNQCHDRATLQGVRIPSAILKIVFRHFYFLFLMQFRLWRAAAFVSSPIHLFERSMCDFLFSSVQTTALIFFGEKCAFIYAFQPTDEQKNKRTDRQTNRRASLSRNAPACTS